LEKWRSVGNYPRTAELKLSAPAAQLPPYLNVPESVGGPDPLKADTIKTIGDFSWMILEEDGHVRLGVERSFLYPIGKIQSIYLPAAGDILRQGGAYLQIFSADMRAHSIMSPLSGVITEVNQKVLDDPNSALQDPYGDGWLVRLKPTRFDADREVLGL